MTTKERWLAAFRLEPVDHLPFWPKLDAAYPRARSAPFRDLSLEAMHAWMGSDMLVWLPNVARQVRKKTSVEVHRENGIERTVFRTRSGRTELVKRFDVASQSWHPVKFPVRTRDEIRILTESYADCTVELDRGKLEKTSRRVRELGPAAVTSTTIGESPLMYWVEWLAGVENAHYLLKDFPGEVEGLFEAVHRVLLRTAEILCEYDPSDMLSLNENTSTTLISPQQYRRWCARHVGEYGRIARQAGRLLYLHMCGRLKALLNDLAGLPVDAFEAFTSPPIGDTTLLDGRRACPDKCLIGGTNATLWTRTAEEIIARIESDLDALPHHRGLVVTSAGVMPPLCEPDTIKEVCERVKAYEVRT